MKHRGRPAGRPLLAASAALLAAVLLGGHGTYAYWADQADMRSQPLSAGTIDVALDGNLRGTSGSGGTWQNSSFALDAVLPGESRAVSFPVENAGTSPLTYAVEASGSGALLPALRFSTYAGGAASNTGSAALGNRSGTCTGTQLSSRVVLTSSPGAVANRRALAVGAAETVCLVVELDTSAANDLQGTSAAATFRFDARQVLP